MYRRKSYKKYSSRGRSNTQRRRRRRSQRGSQIKRYGSSRGGIRL